MGSESITISGKAGLKLHVLAWHLENAKGVVCMVHGLGEHAGRYEEFASKLNEGGFAVFVLDVRGHGQSNGKRGHTPSYDHLLHDIEELLKSAREQYIDLPMFLFGHSMGGNLVVNYVMRMNVGELRGFIASSPWLGLAFDPPEMKIKVAKFLSKIIPGLTQPNELDTSKLSKDKTEVEKYEQDPLVHNKLSLKLFTEIDYASSWALSNTDKLSLDGLIYHGLEDGITDYKKSQKIAEKGEKTEWLPIEGAYHEPHNDHEREVVFEKVISWLKQKTLSS